VKMIKKRVAELEGAQLDWAVAMALGHKVTHTTWSTLMFSSDWSAGGPIIEREHIEILYFGNRGGETPWEAQIGCDTHYIDQGVGEAIAGRTPLQAAMRAFVASKLGDEVEVPE